LFLCKWFNEIGIIDLENVSYIDDMVARADRGNDKDLYAFYESKEFTALRDVYFLFVQD